MNSTVSLYSEIQFVGREQEKKSFDNLLRQLPNEKWVLYLYGPGGMGKTQLLKKFIEMAHRYKDEGHIVIVPQLDSVIDLYWTEHRREETLLRNIALSLAPDGFQEFFAVLQDFENESYQEFDESGLLGQERLRRAFLAGYERLDVERILLVFDTAEQASDSTRRFFRGLLHEMHEIKHQTLVLLAGRPESNAYIFDTFLESSRIDWNIGGLTEREIKKYFKNEGIYNLTQHQIAQLARKVNGRPILIALVVDWIREGNTLDELLQTQDDEFEKNLVSHVSNVKYPEDWIILFMALFDRHFDQEMVPIVLPSPTLWSKGCLDNLKRFSFVKYYSPSLNQKFGKWQLHDEMRDLIKKYVWPEHDMSGQTRNQAMQRIIKEYYDPKISDQMGQNIPDKEHIKTLQLERQYYILAIDFKKGFLEYTNLAKLAEKERESGASHLEALSDEVKPYQEKLTADEKRTLLLNRIIAAAYSERKLNPDILRVVNEQKLDDWAVTQQAELRYRLAQIYARADNPNQVIVLGSADDPETQQPAGEWWRWFQDQLKSKALTGQARRDFIKDFGRLSTTVGMAYRTQNRMNHAVYHFKQAITLYEMVDDAQLEIANVQNNLGYVYQRMGRTDEALAECLAALDIRKRIGKLDQLGYSYNVIGIIRVEQLRPQEAESTFKQALRCFKSAGVERGKGLVLVAYGRLLRQWAEHREGGMGESHEACIEQYQQSNELLNQAVSIFRRLGDWSNLMEALNEKGTLSRQIYQWEDAVAYYTESQKLAKKLENEYRVADNECDFGILYFRMGDFDKALKYSENAALLASNIPAYYLKAKACQTSASVYFENSDYERAFFAAADAAAGILRLSPDLFVDSAAKRTLEYERVIQWLKENIILKLPREYLVEQIIKILIDRWNTEIVDQKTGKKLADEFPGFIAAMARAKRDYQFLRSNKEVRV
jgi:tetratricopeptide (TPR) repeat protein